MRINYTTRNYCSVDIPDEVAEVLRKYAKDNNISTYAAFTTFFNEEVDNEIYECVAWFFQNFFEFEEFDSCYTDFEWMDDDDGTESYGWLYDDDDDDDDDDDETE